MSDWVLVALNAELGTIYDEFRLLHPFSSGDEK